MAEPLPYTPDEMAALLKKDPRMAESMKRIMHRNHQMVQEINRLHMFLYTSIVATGPIRVGPVAMLAFKENFEAFVYDRQGTDFIMDIQRIIVAPGEPDGSKNNEPVAQ